MRRLIFLVVAALLGGAVASASAEEIAVGNYGVSANGMPFGVALVKGYFKEEGLNITGLIASAGGGTSLRNMLAGGGVPYGEVNPGVVISAILAGADLKIISRTKFFNVNSLHNSGSFAAYFSLVSTLFALSVLPVAR